MKRKDLTGLRFGNRLIIRDRCEDQDWISIGKPVPKSPDKYSLGKCLNCGAIIPTLRRNIKLTPLERCVFCSNIGNHHDVETQTNIWRIDGDTAFCKAYHGNKPIEFFIDTDQYEKVSKYDWRISKKKRKFYIVTGENKDGTMMYLHQLVMGQYDDGKQEIDHIDGNSLNNKCVNLRFVTHQENVDNIKALRTDNSTGFRGVSYDWRYDKYTVDFTYHNKRIYVKTWGTLEEAIYCRKCLEEYFGFHLIENNQLYKKYMIKNENIKRYIEDYVQSKLYGIGSLT